MIDLRPGRNLGEIFVREFGVGNTEANRKFQLRVQFTLLIREQFVGAAEGIRPVIKEILVDAKLIVTNGFEVAGKCFEILEGFAKKVRKTDCPLPGIVNLRVDADTGAARDLSTRSDIGTTGIMNQGYSDCDIHGVTAIVVDIRLCLGFGMQVFCNHAFDENAAGGEQNGRASDNGFDGVVNQQRRVRSQDRAEILILIRCRLLNRFRCFRSGFLGLESKEFCHRKYG